MSWCLLLTFEWLGKMFTSVESRWMVYGASLCFSFDFSVHLKTFIIKFRKSKRSPLLGSLLHTRGGPSWRPWSAAVSSQAGLTHDMLQSPWIAHTAWSPGLPLAHTCRHLSLYLRFFHTKFDWLTPLILKGLAQIPSPSGSPPWYFQETFLLSQLALVHAY